jgi:DNA helicase II / ATP-dependent DNA helicase PcrA
MLKKVLEEKFEKIYATLNEAQKLAVDTIDGPVMVIAGPGTGKTQILSARIANILLKTDMYPHNILCLTYTDAGVIAMRKRLLSMIGSDAYNINVCTYHTFCNQIIQQNNSLFDKSNLDAITDLETVQLLRKLIDGFDAENPLKRFRGDVYYDVKNLKALFALVKQEGFDIEYLFTKIDIYIQAIKDDTENKTFYYVKNPKKGQPKQELHDEIKRANKIKAALTEFDSYNKMLIENERYDFNDMLRWVVNIFKTNEDVLRNYQEQYQYILVDEFQDTNGIQNQLVDFLLNYWEQPNVFVVGDDDQSIFRFQGAEISNMLEFKNKHQHQIANIVLTQNYRSTQAILDTAKNLIDENTSRLINQIPNLTKELIASNDKRKATSYALPIIKKYNTKTEEYIGTTIEIEKLIQQGVAPADIAILFTKHAIGTEFASFLKVKNIPFYTKKESDLLEEPLIQKIITVLQYINAELDMPYSGDEYLFHMLHYDWFNISPIEIAKITVSVNEHNYKKQKDVATTSIRAFLQDAVAHPQTNLFDQKVSTQLLTASTAIEKLISSAVNHTFQHFIQLLVNELLVIKYIMQDTNKHYYLKVLTAFLDLIKQETHINPKLDLQSFVALLHTMQKEKIKLPIFDITGAANGVQLLTFHGSKGLEFEYVFLIGSNASNWETKRRPKSEFQLGKYLLTEAQQSANQNLDFEEMRRLYYVGVTRAAHQLYLSYYAFANNGKEELPSVFLQTIMNYQLDQQPTETDKKNAELAWHVNISEDTIAEFNTLLLVDTTIPTIGKLEPDIITKLVEKFTMNVTALNAYLDCPIGFYYKNLIRIPSIKNESATFGTAIHDALKTFFVKMQQHEKNEFPSNKDLIAFFYKELKKHRESFTTEEYERRRQQGPILLNGYYDKYIDTWNKIVVIEYNINAVVKNVPIKGKIDKIEFNGNSVNVVDYKTGSYKNAVTKYKQFQPPNEKNELGGDYWRQAVFYKILIDNFELKKWEVVSAEFDFVEKEDDDYYKQKIVITPADITTVTQQMVTVWDKIQAHDFYTGCGKADCKWCAFAKEHKIDLSNEIDETIENETNITNPIEHL